MKRPREPALPPDSLFVRFALTRRRRRTEGVADRKARLPHPQVVGRADLRISTPRAEGFKV